MRKLLIGLLAFCLASGLWAQQTSVGPPAGAQLTFPADNYPINGPSGAYGLQSCSSVCNGTSLLGPIDLTGYGAVSINITSIGGGATLNFQSSNDPVCATAVNWNSVGAVQDSSQFIPGSGAIATYQISTANTGNYRSQPSSHCFRLQFTAYTSGTVTAQGFLRTIPAGPVAIYGSVGILDANSCPYPGGCSGVGSAVPIQGNATGTTGAVVGTLAAAAAKTTYICGFNVQAIGGTAPIGPITIAGLVTSSQVYQGSASAAGGVVASQTFTPCIPASAQNTAITTTTTANGTATAVDVNSWGFQL